MPLLDNPGFYLLSFRTTKVKMDTLSPQALFLAQSSMENQHEQNGSFMTLRFLHYHRPLAVYDRNYFGGK
jgi:hypothetical protein